MVSYIGRCCIRAKAYPCRTTAILALAGVAVFVTVLRLHPNLFSSGGHGAPPSEGNENTDSDGVNAMQKIGGSNTGSDEGHNDEIPTAMKPPAFKPTPKPTPKPTTKPTPKPTPKPIILPKSKAYLGDQKPLLVIVGENPVPNRNILVNFLDQMRMRYDVRVVSSVDAQISDYMERDYGAVIFERLGVYTEMLNHNGLSIHKYCKDRGIGIVTFASEQDKEPYGENLKLSIFPLHVHRGLSLQDYELEGSSSMLRITKNGGVIKGNIGGTWGVFKPDHETYMPLAYAKTLTRYFLHRNDPPVSYITAVQDSGTFDGIKRVIFGSGLQFWMHRLLFLDALTYVSAENIKLPLERFVSVDIDGVFMDFNGRKMNLDDVNALIKFQKRTQSFVPGFKFNLGYIGGMYKTGTYHEQEANAKLVENADQFWWYDNTYDRLNIRDVTSKLIKDNIKKNQDFAQKHKLKVTNYGVTTNNYGVFPLYDPLYEAWNSVGINVSTGMHIHRAFTHKNIKVLPRETFNMFNKDIFLVNAQEIFRSVEGGETFNSILCNPINIFVTYFCNYGMDRVALYAVARSFDFVRKWTKLKLYSESSYALAERYFTLFPDDVNPLWPDPCKQKLYMPDGSLCDHRPGVLIVGPSITGSETLKSLLEEIKTIAWNQEQLNYFSTDDNYFSGTDRYFKQFPKKSGSIKQINEFCTDYFSNENVPVRAGNLIPNVKIIIVLARPEVVAKECYASEKTSAKLAFVDVISSDPDHHCIMRGMYADHMRRWSTFYTEQQILVLDTDSLYSDTIKTMDRVMDFLHVPVRYDYSQILTFNKDLAVYCRDKECLGTKETPFRNMEKYERDLLVRLYKKQTSLLRGLLTAMKQTVPVWTDKP